jgi:hypothetical protein
MANLTIPPVRVPGTDPQQGARLLGAIRSGSIKFFPAHLYHLPFKYQDFAAAALTKELEVSTAYPNRKFPANVIIRNHVFVDVLELFSGGSIDSCVLDAGNTGDDDGIVDNLDVFTGADTGMRYASNVTGTDLYGFQSALNLTITITCGTGNTNTLETGKGILYVITEAIPRSRG